MGSELKITSKCRTSASISLPGILIAFLVIILTPAVISGQCTDHPTVTLSAPSGATCTISPFVLDGNTFGGNATGVTIREDGSGSVSPTTANTSPFSFTYTPRKKDVGKVITITVTSDIPAGSPCVEAVATFSLSVLDYPGPPSVDLVIQPTCDVSTGSIVFSGLPSTGVWTLTRSPGDVTTTGVGITALVSGIPGGTYTYTVSNWGGCQSLSSDTIIIDQPPDKPPAPVQIIECVVGTNHAGVTVTGPSGPNLEYRLDNGFYQTGNLFENVPDGYHHITVRNSNGCEITGSTFQVLCSCENPSILTLSDTNVFSCYNSPVTITDNTFGGSATGVILTSDGKGILVPSESGSSPFDFTYEPSVEDAGKQITVSVKTVNTSYVCEESATCIITIEDVPGPPAIDSVIPPDCINATGSVILSNLPSVGTWMITRLPDRVKTYGTGLSTVISGIVAGTYSFEVTDSLGCTSFISDNALIPVQPPIPSAPISRVIAQPTCEIPSGSVDLSGLPGSGLWIITSIPAGNTMTGMGTSIVIPGMEQGIYSFTVTNSAGCISDPSEDVVITSSPDLLPAPIISTVSQPTCTKSTGSVTLEGLPSSGDWIIERFPDEVKINGSGTSITIEGILPGNYSFNFTNVNGCASIISDTVLINDQLIIPGAPLTDNIIPPTCMDSLGAIFLRNLPAEGQWTLIRYPGTVNYMGTGTTTQVMGLSSGIYNFTVTNDYGCVSALSSNAEVPLQPMTPSPPVISDVILPSYPSVTGTIVIDGLPSSGSWLLLRKPDNVMLAGNGTKKILYEIPSGEYSYTVQNSSGCVSNESEIFAIPVVDTPYVMITNPDPVCYPQTVDLTSQDITAGSSIDLTYTYWNDKDASSPALNPQEASAGTYYIKGTNSYLFFSVQPVIVIVRKTPVADAGPDQKLDYNFRTTLEAVADSYISGVWSVLSGSAYIERSTDPHTVVMNLSKGENVLLWTVSDDVCPMSFDTVSIFVNDFRIPSLITPNMDGINDYFVISWGENAGDKSLVIFDRRGIKVYENSHYNNSWNGVDNNGKALPSDTYFFTLKTVTGKQLSGYIVIRR